MRRTSTPGAGSRRPATAPRDVAASAFVAILDDLIGRIPGARSAILVDYDGEAVDYGGQGDPFDIKVGGAHWRIILGDLRPLIPTLGEPRTLLVRAEQRSFVIHALHDGYALVVTLTRRAGFTGSSRALEVCARAIGLEAGWPPAPPSRTWYAVEVEAAVPSGRGRPCRLLGGDDAELEVLGAVMGLATRERGYRVRLRSGAELTLVREPGGHWYADDDPHRSR